jgi:type 1 glutamine amidotransferase
MRRCLLISILAGMIVLVFCIAADAGGRQPATIPVLLISGDDVSAHDWREMSEATREVLVNSGRFEVKVCEDPLILESETALRSYQAIVFLLYNQQVPMLTKQAQDNLLSFVKGGKGFYSQHLASGAFSQWEEFGKLCGRKWVMGTSGHGPRGEFQARIVDKEHPITKGMEDFTADDELYSKLQGTGEIHPLVEADSDWSSQTEPMVFSSRYGEGRSVHNALGHDRKAIMNPNMQKLIARSVEWVATGNVAD